MKDISCVDNTYVPSISEEISDETGEPAYSFSVSANFVSTDTEEEREEPQSGDATLETVPAE